DYTGAIEQWIELGQPDEGRLRKASGRAAQVVVVGYGGQAAEAWWKRNAATLGRLRNLTVMELDDAELDAAGALLGRGMRVTAMIQDGELQLMDTERSVTLRPRMRMVDGVPAPG
ncbi:MAG TPA: YaeQ family protein, partial [Thermomonas sp.]|nr:YaeQ family protein [Thermomonas sp.]